jgi:hypothetical protein
MLREACSQAYPESAICVQRFDDSLNSAIRITYRISLRSSSLREPRYPLLRVVFRCTSSKRPQRARAARLSPTDTHEAHQAQAKRNSTERQVKKGVSNGGQPWQEAVYRTESSARLEGRIAGRPANPVPKNRLRSGHGQCRRLLWQARCECA